MKTVSESLKAHLSAELANMACLIKITRADGTVKGLTDHDADLTYGGLTYVADAGAEYEGWKDQISFKAGSFYMTGLFDDQQIRLSEIKMGLYDHARVDVYLCNWKDLSAGVLYLRRGWIGSVKAYQQHYVAEILGMQDLLDKRVGDIYTPECRHNLGALLCGVSVSSLAVASYVTGVINQNSFSDFMRGEVDGYFDYGLLTWNSGANSGLSVEVLSSVQGVITLWLPMPEPISMYDHYSLTPGCDKRFATCCNKFSNGTNYGGFPHLAGLSKILQYPSSS